MNRREFIIDVGCGLPLISAAQEPPVVMLCDEQLAEAQARITDILFPPADRIWSDGRYQGAGRP